MGTKAEKSLIPIALDANQRYSLAEAQAVLRQSRTKTYLDIRAGNLRAIRVGARVYVPGSELIRLSTLPMEQQA